MPGAWLQAGGGGSGSGRGAGTGICFERRKISDPPSMPTMLPGGGEGASGTPIFLPVAFVVEAPWNPLPWAAKEGPDADPRGARPLAQGPHHAAPAPRPAPRPKKYIHAYQFAPIPVPVIQEFLEPQSRPSLSTYLSHHCTPPSRYSVPESTLVFPRKIILYRAGEKKSEQKPLVAQCVTSWGRLKPAGFRTNTQSFTLRSWFSRCFPKHVFQPTHRNFAYHKHASTH